VRHETCFGSSATTAHLAKFEPNFDIIKICNLLSTNRATTAKEQATEACNEDDPIHSQVPERSTKKYLEPVKMCPTVAVQHRI
jgi:hypothetical protein